MLTQGSSTEKTNSAAATTGGQPRITDLLKRGRIYSAEVIPPRNGTETRIVLQQIETMKKHGVDFISVTKGAGGSLRGGTLPIAQAIMHQYGLCSLAHFTCRDYTIAEIENTLMDHFYFGIRNILALRGDPPDGQQDHFQPAPNRHSYAYQLVTQIAALNRGEYLVREGFDQVAASQTTRPGQSTDFCIGVAVYPEHEPFLQGVDYLRLKVAAGAHFGITQMLFQSEPYEKFMEACAQAGLSLPVIPGLRIVTNATTAERMVKKFGVKIPRALISSLQNASSKEESKKRGLEFTWELSQKLLRAGAPGIHLFIMNDENTAGELLKLLKQ